MVLTGLLLACTLAFLVGSFPTGMLVGYAARGIDIRDHGSGNVGATNVFRTLGKTWGIFVFAVDALKGFLVTTLGFRIAVGALAALDPAFSVPDSWQTETLRLLVGVAVVAGHVWSIFLRFDGGKGVATGVGALLGTDPLVAAFGFAVFIAVFIPTRYVSLGSILGTGFAVLASLILEREMGGTLFIAAVFLVVFVRHRENIVRLWNGTEQKFSFKKIETPPTS